MGNKSTYRLLPYDGLETVISPTVHRLINTLDLQSHLENMTLFSDQLNPGKALENPVSPLTYIITEEKNKKFAVSNVQVS